MEPKVGSYWLLEPECDPWYVVIVEVEDPEAKDARVYSRRIDLDESLETPDNHPEGADGFSYLDSFFSHYAPLEDYLPIPCPKCEAGFVEDKDYLCRSCRFGL
jgi:hypothetical protein